MGATGSPPASASAPVPASGEDLGLLFNSTARESVTVAPDTHGDPSGTGTITDTEAEARGESGTDMTVRPESQRPMEFC